MCVLSSTKTGLAALELMRHLCVNDKTAWRIKHHVMQSLPEREEKRQLDRFMQLDDAGHDHTTLETGGGRAATEVSRAGWVNVVLGNVKHAINGANHSVRQTKHARRHLVEAVYRFNLRFRLAEPLPPRIAIAMMRCRTHAESRLRMATSFIG